MGRGGTSQGRGGVRTGAPSSVGGGVIPLETNRGEGVHSDRNTLGVVTCVPGEVETFRSLGRLPSKEGFGSDGTPGTGRYRNLGIKKEKEPCKSVEGGPASPFLSDILFGCSNKDLMSSTSFLVLVTEETPVFLSQRRTS